MCDKMDRESLNKKTLAGHNGLHILAENLGIKQPGVGWPKCCPPKGRKADVIEAILKQQQESKEETPEKKLTQPKSRVDYPKRQLFNADSKDEPSYSEGELSGGEEAVSATIERKPLGWKVYSPRIPKTGPITLVKTLQLAKDGYDNTKALLDCGAKMPEYVPLVCPSFSSKNLGSPDAKSQRLNSTDEGVGRDPWGICDYLRDELLLPTESFFIDSECFGDYYRPPNPGQNCTLTYNNSDTMRPWCAKGTWEVEEVDEKNPYAAKRNYRAVYKWAQRVSKVLIFFLSHDWFESENCKAELEDVFRDSMHRTAAFDRTVIFAVLDNDTSLFQQAKEYREQLLEKWSGMSIKLIDLSGFMDFLQNGTKFDLKETSRNIQEMACILADLLGLGDEELFCSEREFMIRNCDSPSIKKPDINGNPVRNHHLPAFQRRININTADVAKLKARLPGIGPTKSRTIVEYRNKLPGKKFVEIEELRNVKGIGEVTFNDILPFITLTI